LSHRTAASRAVEVSSIGSVADRFRAFAFFPALEDLETFSTAVLFADSELCRQAEVFGLLFGLPSRSSLNNWQPSIRTSEGWY
jgi:hypothetical protein